MDLNFVLQQVRYKTNHSPKKLSSGTYQAKCPCHDDKTESLSITAKDGKVLIHCHAGCEYKNIADTLELYKNGNINKKVIDKIYDYIE